MVLNKDYEKNDCMCAQFQENAFAKFRHLLSTLSFDHTEALEYAALHHIKLASLGVGVDKATNSAYHRITTTDD